MYEMFIEVNREAWNLSWLMIITMLLVKAKKKSRNVVFSNCMFLMV